jgi:hypothetical protein
MDLEWETGTAQPRSQSPHGRPGPAASRLRSAAGQRRVSGPVQPGGSTVRFSDPAPIDVDEDAPWYAALPPSLLAPADAPTPDDFDAPAEVAERTRAADRAVVPEELSILATPGPTPSPTPTRGPGPGPTPTRGPGPGPTPTRGPGPGPTPTRGPGPGPVTTRRRPGRPSPPVEEWAPVYDPVTGRRTVTIRGRGAERTAPIAPSGVRRARAAAPRHERSGFVADRAAMWAVLLGVLLILIAVASAHG